MCDNRCHATIYEISCKRWQTIVLAIGPAEFYFYVAAINVADVAQTLPKRTYRTFE
jgi:hypothetical protein